MAAVTFYRAQSDKSYTYYEDGYGFEAKGHYLMDLSHWLNKGKLERHLDWHDRSSEPTPFISVFDDRSEYNPSLLVLFTNKILKG